MLLEPHDYKTGIAQHLEKILENSPFRIEKKEDEQGVWFYFPENT
jgi:hypothetical protein